MSAYCILDMFPGGSVGEPTYYDLVIRSCQSPCREFDAGDITSYYSPMAELTASGECERECLSSELVQGVLSTLQNLLGELYRNFQIFCEQFSGSGMQSQLQSTQDSVAVLFSICRIVWVMSCIIVLQLGCSLYHYVLTFRLTF
jgi:hypothetical protein